MTTALITGATSGIGLSIARQLAGRGHDLVLVSRDAERLQLVAAEITLQFGRSCEVLPADLADLDQSRAVEARLADEGRPIEWLVANAGFGIKQPFDASTVEGEQAMIDILISSPMRLAHAALPGMLARGSGRILIVSSVASFAPMGTYSAAKAWATCFAESLQLKYGPDGVHTTALCPGFTRTEFHERADIDMTGLPEFLWLDADAVAAAGIDACEAGRALSVPGLVYKGVYRLTELVPRSVKRAIVGRMQ